MDRIKQQQNRGYLITGIGALVALLAFLLFPYTSITLTCSSNCSGVTNFSLALNATLIAQASTAQSQSSGNFLSGSVIPFQGQGALWFLPILTLAALALTGLLLYRDIPFGKGMNASAATQKKWVNYALISIAALSVLVQIVLLSNLGTQFQNSFNSNNSSSVVTASAGGHAGFWFYLLGMAAVAGGVILTLVQANKSALPLQVSYQPPSQPWQSPSNSYPQQNPTGQYPPPQNPYPTGQYPPTSYPPQPPYPPGQ
jgi:hypothetical protein